MSEPETIVRVAAKGDGVTASGRHVPLAAPGDTVGADGAHVSQIVGFNNVTDSTPDPVDHTFTVNGQYGTLTINEDGSYTYTANPNINNASPVTDTFTYTLTPGVPSFAAAAAALKRELTIPEVAQSLVLTRVSGRASKMPPGETLAAFGRTGATLAIHLAIHAIDKVAAELTPHYGADCPVAVVLRASWPDERIVRATLGTVEAALAADPIERTALIFVGRSLAAEDFSESSLYDPAYQRRFRNRQ